MKGKLKKKSFVKSKIMTGKEKVIKTRKTRKKRRLVKRNVCENIIQNREMQTRLKIEKKKNTKNEVIL